MAPLDGEILHQAPAAYQPDEMACRAPARYDPNPRRVQSVTPASALSPLLERRHLAKAWFRLRYPRRGGWVSGFLPLPDDRYQLLSRFCIGASIGRIQLIVAGGPGVASDQALWPCSFSPSSQPAPIMSRLSERAFITAL